MMKFGDGIDGVLFELLGAGNYNGGPFGDSISDANAVRGGSATATNQWTRAKRKGAKVQCPN